MWLYMGVRCAGRITAQCSQAHATMLQASVWYSILGGWDQHTRGFTSTRWQYRYRY